MVLDNSQGYKYYRQKLEEFRKAKAGSTGTPTAPDLGLKRRSPPETPLGSTPTATACPTSPAPLPTANPSAATPGKPATTANVKRKRKSRWGPEEDKVELPPAELAQRDADAAPSPLSGGPAPVSACGEALASVTEHSALRVHLRCSTCHSSVCFHLFLLGTSLLFHVQF